MTFPVGGVRSLDVHLTLEPEGRDELDSLETVERGEVLCHGPLQGGPLTGEHVERLVEVAVIPILAAPRGHVPVMLVIEPVQQVERHCERVEQPQVDEVPPPTECRAGAQDGCQGPRVGRAQEGEREPRSRQGRIGSLRPPRPLPVVGISALFEPAAGGPPVLPHARVLVLQRTPGLGYQTLVQAEHERPRQIVTVAVYPIEFFSGPKERADH